MNLCVPKLILFDLDGTLVDTAPDLTRSVNATLAALQLAPCQETEIRQWIGGGAEILLKHALQKNMQQIPDAQISGKANDLFLEHYSAHVCEQSRCYPNVHAALTKLQQYGVLLGCVTNKRTCFTQPILQQTKLAAYFTIVVSGDTLAKKKPYPLPLIYAAKQLAIDPKATWMVGDSSNDIQAARAARMPILCVDYGYNHGQDIYAQNPDRVISDFQQLQDIYQHANAA